MFYKEIIDEKSVQIVNCINNFLNVFMLESDAIVKIGTKDNGNNSECYMNIIAKDYNFSKNLKIKGSAKRLLYDRVFNMLISEYENNESIIIQRYIHQDLMNGNSWQLLLKNHEKKNKVVVEFAIENENDFKWANDVFTTREESNISQKVLKLEN